MSSEVDWKRRPEGGGRLAVSLIAWIARHCGRPVARAYGVGAGREVLVERLGRESPAGRRP